MIRDERLLTNIDHKTACKNFVKAATKGVIKVMSKMGISTIQSYRGAQVFEAVGLRQDVIDEYFTWTPSRIGGIGLDVIAQEVLMRHRAAFPERHVNGHTLPVGGQYQWRADGEYPPLQSRSRSIACRRRCAPATSRQFKEYSRLINEQATNSARCAACSISSTATPVPLEEVESDRKHHEALQDRRDVLRLDQQGSARDAGHRDEPHRRQEQHRRRRRRSGALRAECRTATRRTPRSSRSRRAASA